jgi:hypothetical protein
VDECKALVLGFSHGQLSPPNGAPYAEFVARRMEECKSAVRKTLGKAVQLDNRVCKHGIRRP